MRRSLVFSLRRQLNPVHRLRSVSAKKSVKFKRDSSSHASSFVELVSATSSRFQLYLACSDDPYINLSIESYLLDKSHADSTILLFYINRPCIVIGRNQNPWLEVNLAQLRHNPLGEPVELVRRHSGGGTVFHDHGNVNFSVIRPVATFTRDKAVEMVARALRAKDPRVRVNERHDIVVKLGDDEGGGTRKVSGSAYKLTRNRALHHATCLVESPNLPHVSRLLGSPAAPYIKARGIESVRSPIQNLFPGAGSRHVDWFVCAVLDMFAQEHGLGHDFGDSLIASTKKPFLQGFPQGVYGLLGHDIAGIDQIQEGITQLKSAEWRYGQTPQFTFSTHPENSASHQRHAPAGTGPPDCDFSFVARGGAITTARLRLPENEHGAPREDGDWGRQLEGTKVQELRSWRDSLATPKALTRLPNGSGPAMERLADWLDGMFGLPRASALNETQR